MTEREVPSVHGLVIGVLGGTGDQGRGLALRFARVVRYRDDKSPAEADTIDAVCALY